VQQTDSQFSIALTDCDGSQSSIVAAASCVIPVNTLRNAPYSLDWGSSVYAKLIATNVEGSSIESLSGNGAIIITDPTAPSNLIEEYSQRTSTSIGMSWTAEYDGGAPILDYSISIANNDGNFAIQAVTTDTFYTATSLTPG
jgi:hypothetical protein